MSPETSNKPELIEVDGGAPVEVRIFPCARPWDGLTATASVGVRHCDSCNQMVHHIEDAEGMRLAIAAKQCVRVALRGSGYVLGEMLPIDYNANPTELNWDE